MLEKKYIMPAGGSVYNLSKFFNFFSLFYWCIMCCAQQTENRQLIETFCEFMMYIIVGDYPVLVRHVRFGSMIFQGCSQQNKK